MEFKYNFNRIKVLVTSACNSNCTHCFRFSDKNIYILPDEKLIEIVNFGIDNGCNNFSFSGGEFFTHPFAYKLIEYCILKKVNISILTNALEIDKLFFKNVFEKELISFQVSIDGMEQKHDLRRGLGSYNKTIENVKFLYNNGYQITAKMVIDEKNYVDLIDVIKLPWFDKVLVLPVADFSGKINHKNKTDSFIEYEKVITYMYRKMATDYNNQYLCNGFPNELAIKYNGDVFPCTEAREHNEYSMGNILKKSIACVIDEYSNKNNNKLNCSQIKVKKCQLCNFKNICQQGCRLRAKHFFESFNAPDPFNCRVFNKEYIDIPIGKLFWGEKNSKN